jgi:hypothetical protein
MAASAAADFCRMELRVENGEVKASSIKSNPTMGGILGLSVLCRLPYWDVILHSMLDAMHILKNVGEFICKTMNGQRQPFQPKNPDAVPRKKTTRRNQPVVDPSKPVPREMKIQKRKPLQVPTPAWRLAARQQAEDNDVLKFDTERANKRKTYHLRKEASALEFTKARKLVLTKSRILDVSLALKGVDGSGTGWLGKVPDAFRLPGNIIGLD